MEEEKKLEGMALLASVDPHFAPKPKEPVTVESTVTASEEKASKWPAKATIFDEKRSNAMILSGIGRGQEIHDTVVYLGEGEQPLFALNLMIIMLKKGGVIFFPKAYEDAVSEHENMKVLRKRSPRGYKQAQKKID
jgi:hypothetical protein